MEQSTCVRKGGEWVAGMTGLTSYCVEKGRQDALSALPPSETDLISLRDSTFLLDPTVEEVVRNARFRSHVLDVPDASMKGIGPLGGVVSWPLAPGDVVWRSEETPDNSDALRRMGVYLGSGIVVYLGNARRAVSPRDGRVYWASAPTQGGARTMSPESFVGDSAKRCGIYNPTDTLLTRMDTVLLAAACVGVPFARLSRPDAQHIAAYVRTGVWLAEMREGLDRRVASPVYFAGEFRKSKMGAATAGITFDTSSVVIDTTDTCEPGEIPEHKNSYVTLKSNEFTITYPTTAIAEELYRQKQAVQPYHEPFTGAFLAEDQVGSILLTAVDYKVALDESREMI